MEREMDVTKSYRVGYIDVSIPFLPDFWRNNKDFVPIETQMRHVCHSIRYLCYCAKFDKLKEGQAIPVYQCTFIREDVSGMVFLKEVVREKA